MSFSIISTGDVMLGENVHHFQRGIVKKFKNRYSSLIGQDIKDFFKEADFVLINLESSFASGDHFKTRNISNGVYVAPEESLSLIKELNSSVIANIANNHFSQHGVESATFSKNLLKQNGIQIIGETRLPLTISKNELLLKIWGVSLVEDRNECGAYFKSTYEELLTDIDPEPKKDNEFRIISIHWGDEYNTLENNKQKTLARQLSLAGFDLVLGHHPHVIQPVGKIGNTRVIYSHGNFIFDQNFSGLTQKGLICKFNYPENKPNYLFSHQKSLKVVGINSIEEEKLNIFCKQEYKVNMPLMMRVKMKLELLRHFYELNNSIIKTFLFRAIQK